MSVSILKYLFPVKSLLSVCVCVPGSRGNGGVPDSDADDSLYSTVKPNHRGRGRSQVPVPADPEEHEAPSKPKKATRLTPSQLTQKPMEGVDNHAFVGE